MVYQKLCYIFHILFLCSFYPLMNVFCTSRYLLTESTNIIDVQWNMTLHSALYSVMWHLFVVSFTQSHYLRLGRRPHFLQSPVLGFPNIRGYFLCAVPINACWLLASTPKSTTGIIQPEFHVDTSQHSYLCKANMFCLVYQNRITSTKCSDNIASVSTSSCYAYSSLASLISNYPFL